jgi:hypothetical protein
MGDSITMDTIATVRTAIESYTEGRWHTILADIDTQEMSEHINAALVAGHKPAAMTELDIETENINPEEYDPPCCAGPENKWNPNTWCGCRG